LLATALRERVLSVQVYPNERHGIRSAEANEHFETVLISFLQKNLWITPSARKLSQLQDVYC